MAGFTLAERETARLREIVDGFREVGDEPIPWPVLEGLRASCCTPTTSRWAATASFRHTCGSVDGIGAGGAVRRHGDPRAGAVEPLLAGLLAGDMQLSRPLGRLSTR